MKMDSILAKLDIIIKKNNKDIILHLNDGLKDYSIENELKNVFSFPFLFEDIFKQIYLWHNGTKINYTLPAEKFYLFPTFYLNSFKDIIDIVKNDSIFYFKENNYLPFFSSGRGEYLAIKLYQNYKKSKVYYVSTWNPTFENCISIFDSIYLMLFTIIECYKKGVYFIDLKDNLINSDFDREIKIAKSINPLSEYWQKL